MTKDKRIRAALETLFKLTGAEYIEFHSGDREPGNMVSRKSILRKEKST